MNKGPLIVFLQIIILAIIHFAVVFIAFETLVHGWIAIVYYFVVLIALRVSLIDKFLAKKWIKESQAMSVLLFMPILIVGSFYLVNYIPLHGKLKLYEAEIITFKTKMHNTENDGPRLDYTLEIELDGQKEILHISGNNMNVAGHVDESKNYKYIAIQARKGLLGFYITDMNRHIIYNW